MLHQLMLLPFPSLERMHELLAIAERYFLQAQIVDRDKAPQW